MKVVRWATKEAASDVIDFATADKPPKYDQKFMNEQTNKWSGRAVDVKKLITDTENLTGPWERIDVLNKTLGRIMKILDIQEVAG